MTENILHTEDTEPVFRVLRLPNWSLGLKLEPQFWSLLKVVAHSEDKSLSEYVNDILSSSSPKNKSSYLRAYIVSWVNDKNLVFRDKLRSSNIVRDLHISPIPSVTVTRDCRLFSCNAEFIDLLRNKLVTMDEVSIKPTYANISFERPIDQIFMELDKTDTKTVKCGYKVIVNDKVMSFTARAAKVNSIDGDVLILYNLNPN